MHTLAVVGSCLAAAAIGVSQAAGQRGAVQSDAVTTIIDAFQTHSVVGLDEVHADERSHGFRLRLIRDPRFAAIVDDLVVEFGNSRYQDVIDRFVGGGAVTDVDLKKVWQNTTQAHTIWDRPIYEAFFRAVRALNLTLPRARRLRVLLGDPPIDWDAIRTAEDRLKWLQMGRSRYVVGIIRREVLAKHRRALVIYGALHLIRQNLQGANLIEHLETNAGTRAFVILTHPFASVEALGFDPADWRAPRIALTKGTPLENQMDAVLYLGPASESRQSRLAESLCADAEYRRMRAHRMALAGIVDAAERLATECASAR